MTNTRKDILQEARNPVKDRIRYRKRVQQEEQDRIQLEDDLKRAFKELEEHEDFDAEG